MIDINVLNDANNITKREIFALVAMHGLLLSKPEDVALVPSMAAMTSFLMADEMIRESEKNG